jgi:hypothetical protein
MNTPAKLATRLMVLCPFIFLYTSSEPLSLKLQPTEVASVHWVSLRALLSPSLRTVEHVDLAKRYARQSGVAFQVAQRWMTGYMEFSALQLIPTESLFCSSIPGFVPESPSSSSFLGRLKKWAPSHHAILSERRRPLLLWGLTLGILADFLDMLPPHNAIQLWKYPTFTAPDLRLIVALLTYHLRKENALQMTRTPRRPSQTALDAQTAAVAVIEGDKSEHDPIVSGIGTSAFGRFLSSSSATRRRNTTHAVGIMLNGYYNRLRMAMYVFALWRLAAGSVGAWYIWRWLRRRR